MDKNINTFKPQEKLEKLTDEQKARFPEFIDKWKKVAFSTAPADKEKAEEGINRAYMDVGLNKPRIVWCPSPFAMFTAQAFLMRSNFAAYSKETVRENVRMKVIEKMGSKARMHIGKEIWDEIWNPVRGELDRIIHRGVINIIERAITQNQRGYIGEEYDSVVDVINQSWQETAKRFNKQDVIKAIAEGYPSEWVSSHGQHDSYILSFFDVITELTGVTFPQLHGIRTIAENAGWWIPHRKICWVSERHTEIHLNDQQVLSKDEGAAVLYPDGWGIYALNGIPMLKAYVMTPAEQIDPGRVLAELNVDMRRELLRKIGIERFLEKAPHKVLDTQGNYSLLSIHLSESIPDARYLKMVNPSIGCFHVEGVEPACKTVREALNWRTTGDSLVEWIPEILT